MDVLPLIESTVPHLTKSLRLGIAYADEQQPDPSDRDPWFWSHSARFRARRHLLGVEQSDGWTLKRKVPNSGIHLRVQGVHAVRVLRSLDSTVPHPGRNRRRRKAWNQGVQGTLMEHDDGLPPLSLLMDWQVHDEEPVIHVSLPKRPWSYRENPDLHWRVPVTGDSDQDLSKLHFDPGLIPGDVMVTIKVDPAEKDAG